MDNENTNNNDIVSEDSDDPEKLKQERDEYLNGWQRAKADFVNYKKDEIKRFEIFARVANEELIRELIIVLDSFDLAISALEKEGKVEKGVYLIRNQLADTLKKFGSEKIEVKIGEPFNPSFEEALVMVESEKDPGTVLEEIESGYTLNGKVMRPARVKVAK